VAQQYKQCAIFGSKNIWDSWHFGGGKHGKVANAGSAGQEENNWSMDDTFIRLILSRKH
jgi:hypothetical protein